MWLPKRQKIENSHVCISSPEDQVYQLHKKRNAVLNVQTPDWAEAEEYYSPSRSNLKKEKCKVNAEMNSQ